MHTKKLATSKISDEEIRMNQNISNNRTRKRLGMKTSAEAIYKTLKYVELKTWIRLKKKLWDKICDVHIEIKPNFSIASRKLNYKLCSNLN